MRPMVTIAAGGSYAVASQGNGLFVRLTYTPSGRSAFLQGQEAAAFLDQLEAIKAAWAPTTPAEYLPIICHDYIFQD